MARGRGRLTEDCRFSLGRGQAQNDVRPDEAKGAESAFRLL
jgi:hypothetical protein